MNKKFIRSCVYASPSSFPIEIFRFRERITYAKWRYLFGNLSAKIFVKLPYLRITERLMDRANRCGRGATTVEVETMQPLAHLVSAWHISSNQPSMK